MVWASQQWGSFLRERNKKRQSGAREAELEYSILILGSQTELSSILLQVTIPRYPQEGRLQEEVFILTVTVLGFQYVENRNLKRGLVLTVDVTARERKSSTAQTNHGTMIRADTLLRSQSGRAAPQDVSEH